MNRYLFWIVRLCIIGIILAPLVLSPHTVFPFVVGKSLWIRSLIIIAVTSFSILAFRKPEFRPKFSKILIVFGIFILINFVAAVYGSSFTKSFWSNWERMDGVLELIFWFLILVVAVSTFRNLDDWKVLFRVNICVGFVVAVLSVGQLFNIDFTFLSFLPFTVMYLGEEEVYTVGRITSTVGNPTFLGPYLAIVVIMASGFLYERVRTLYDLIISKYSIWNRDLIFTVLLFLGILLSLWVILLTGSRGTLLGLASSLLLLFLVLLFVSNNLWVRILSGLTLVGFIGSLILVIWINDYIKTISYENNEKIVKEFIGDEKYIPFGPINANSSDIASQDYFDSMLTREEQERLMSNLFKNLLTKKNDEGEDVLAVIYEDKGGQQLKSCDKEYLFLRNISPTYFNGYEKREVLFDEDLKVFHDTLIKNPDTQVIMSDGNLLYHFMESILPGGNKVCGKLYQFFYSIHPSIAYIINEGVDLKGRSLGWSQAWSGFKERPILGWGPENFDLVFFKYLKGTDYQGYPPAKLDRAHSRPLDVLVTTGILGFILWAALWILIFFSIIKNILKNDKNLVIYLIVFSSLTTYFVSSLFLFPQATWYVQFFILIGVVSRSDDGFLSTVDLREVVIKKKRKRSSDEANMGNVIVTLVSVLIGIIVFYWLIIIPYYVSSNTLPISNSKNLDELEEIAARFEPLASYGRLEILYKIIENLDQIAESATPEQFNEILENTVTLGSIILNDEPNNFLLHQALFNFYFNLSRSDGSYFIKAEEHAKKLINLSPEHINAHESMIRLALVKRDFPESKKWIDKWKTDHPLLRFKDKVFWDDYLLQLEIENLE